MSTPTSSLWQMADARLDGRLARRLASMRRRGVSYELIARQLHTEYGVHVSARTVANWLQQLEGK